MSRTSAPPSADRLGSAPTSSTDALPRGPIAFAPASSSGAATRTPGMLRTRASVLCGKPCGSRASSCSVALPAIPRESLRHRALQARARDLRGEQQRDAGGDADDRKALLHEPRAQAHTVEVQDVRQALISAERLDRVERTAAGSGAGSRPAARRAARARGRRSAAAIGSWLTSTTATPRSRHSSRSSSSTSRPRWRVEAAGRLVGEQQARLGGERAGDHHALALAHRQRLGAMVQALSQPEALEQRRDLALCLAPAHRLAAASASRCRSRSRPAAGRSSGG